MKNLIVLSLLLVGLAYSQNPYYPIYVTSDSIVRPANATAYAVNDVVNDSNSTAKRFIFPYVVKPGGRSSIILSALMEVDTANTTNATFRLLLFTDTVGTVADNAAWTPAHANNDLYVGAIDFSLASNGTGTAMGESFGLNIPFHKTEGDARLYGVLLAKGAYTPKHLGKVRIKLGILRY